MRNRVLVCEQNFDHRLNLVWFDNRETVCTEFINILLFRSIWTRREEGRVLCVSHVTATNLELKIPITFAENCDKNIMMSMCSFVIFIFSIKNSSQTMFSNLDLPSSKDILVYILDYGLVYGHRNGLQLSPV